MHFNHNTTSAIGVSRSNQHARTSSYVNNHGSSASADSSLNSINRNHSYGGSLRKTIRTVSKITWTRLRCSTKGCGSCPGRIPLTTLVGTGFVYDVWYHIDVDDVIPASKKQRTTLIPQHMWWSVPSEVQFLGHLLPGLFSGWWLTELC